MEIKALVDLAIEDNPHARMLWVPARHWQEFCDAIKQRPNIIGAVIYRDKTIRDGGSIVSVQTHLD